MRFRTSSCEVPHLKHSYILNPINLRYHCQDIVKSKCRYLISALRLFENVDKKTGVMQKAIILLAAARKQAFKSLVFHHYFNGSNEQNVSFVNLIMY